MSKRSKQVLALVLTLAALGGTTIARADDNSMNPLTGESRAAFDANSPNLSNYNEGTFNGSPSNSYPSNGYTYRTSPYGSTVQEPVVVTPSAPVVVTPAAPSAY